MQAPAVLILGGGVMQLPAIEAGKRLGRIVHVADGNAQCVGVEDADVFHHIDLQDIDGLVHAARNIPNLQGVFTAGTDFSYSVAVVADACKLPGTPPDSALRASHKNLMRDAFRAQGVPIPGYYTLSAEEGEGVLNREEAYAELLKKLPPFPLVVKPVDNMGSRGVIRCDHVADLVPAIAGAREFAREGTVILEEWIPGQEYSLDAIVIDGVVRVTGIGVRHIFFPPYFVEMGHSIPAPLEPEERHALIDVFSQAISALGITNGAAKGDIFLIRNSGTPKAMVGEVAARLSGGYMSGWTYPAATGVPLTEIGLRVALGEHPGTEQFTEKQGVVVTERALVSPPGRVREVILPAAARSEAVALFVRCKPGDSVAPPKNNVEKVANVITAGSSLEEAEARGMSIISQIVVRLEPANKETDAYLFGGNKIGTEQSRIEQSAIGQSPIEQSPIEQSQSKDPRALLFHGEETSFDWYALEPDSLSIPWIHGTVDQLIALLPGPLPVHDRTHEMLLRPRFPVPPAMDVLNQLLAEGVIALVPAGSPALDRAFWQPFARAGHAGVWYVVDSMHHIKENGTSVPWEGSA